MNLSRNEVNLKSNEKEIFVPIWEKANLTLNEAAEFYNIGVNKLRDITNEENCPFVLFVGSKRLIKRKQFDAYMECAYSI